MICKLYNKRLCHRFPCQKSGRKSCQRIEKIQKPIKPVSDYTRPHFKKGIGWMVYGKPANLFYCHKETAK